MNYDKWKQQAPPSEEDFRECAFCGEHFENVGLENYCSPACKRADNDDRDE